jgi:hypothetical protein
MIFHGFGWPTVTRKKTHKCNARIRIHSYGKEAEFVVPLAGQRMTFRIGPYPAPVFLKD